MSWRRLGSVRIRVTRISMRRICSHSRAPPLTLKPTLASSGAETVTASPSELEIRLSPPQVELEIEGLEAESVEAPDGGAATDFPGPTGSAQVRVRATLAGYKPMETEPDSPARRKANPVGSARTGGIEGRVDGPSRQLRLLAPDPSPDLGGVPGAPGSDTQIAYGGGERPEGPGPIESSGAFTCIRSPLRTGPARSSSTTPPRDSNRSRPP